MRPCMLAMALLACLARGEDEKAEPPPPQKRRFQIEILYTIHARLDNNDKLERIRGLVKKAYPEAEFAEYDVRERKMYYAIYRDRLLRRAGMAFADHMREARKKLGPDADEDAVREAASRIGYELVKEQVAREVMLGSTYDSLFKQATDDRGLKEVFDKLKAKDDPKDPVCSTEPGKALIVYRDFGGKGLTGREIEDIEDGGVRFGPGVRARVASIGAAAGPKMCPKAETLGAEGDGRQIFRLVKVAE